MTLAMGGDFYDLGGEGEEICFQPLAGIDDESELAWAQDWIADLLHREKAEVTPATKQELWAVLSPIWRPCRGRSARLARSWVWCRMPTCDRRCEVTPSMARMAGCSMPIKIR